MIWNDADIEMAEATRIADHMTHLLGGGMTEQEIKQCVQSVAAALDAGYYGGSPFEAVTTLLENNPAWRPTDLQFDEIQWDGWHASEEGKQQ